MKRILLKKGEVLQEKGVLNSKVYLVESGLLRSYSIDKKGKEHIFMFAPEGWIIADSVGATTQTELYIDAIEDSVVIQNDKEIAAINDAPKLVKRIEVLQHRVIMLMSATALERFEHFKKAYPNIVQRVPQRMVASFLGITPEALSTLKRKTLI